MGIMEKNILMRNNNDKGQLVAELLEVNNISFINIFGDYDQDTFFAKGQTFSYKGLEDIKRYIKSRVGKKYKEAN